MTARCPYIYSTSGARFRMDEVLVEVEIGDSIVIKKLGERDDESFIRLSSVAEQKVARFYVACGESEIDLNIDPHSCQGRRGRSHVDRTFLESVSAEHGEEVARELAVRLIDNLPSGTKEDEVGESRKWAREAVLSYSRHIPGGVLHVVREHTHVSKLFDKELTPLENHKAGDLLERALALSEDVSASLALREDLRLSSWMAAAAQGGATGSYAVLIRGSDMPAEFLESMVTEGRDVFQRVRALRALAKSNPAISERLSESIIIDAVKGVGGEDRLVESALMSANKTLVSKIALNNKLPWKWSCAAIAASEQSEQSVFASVASDQRAHPLVRLAATARLEDDETLESLTRDRDKRVAERAQRSLGRSPERRAETTVRARPVLEGDVALVELAAIDLDGTMLDDRGAAVAKSVDGVRRFVDSGRTVCFTTTRTLEDALLISRGILDGREGVLVCDEGATICDVSTGLPLRGESLVPGAQTLQKSSDNYLDSYLEEARRLVVGGNVSAEVFRGEDGRVGVRLGGDKGSTLDYVSSMCGVDLSRCMAIGDGKIDTPMFEKVTNAGGISVAVANAQPGVINHPCVGIVTVANEDGGVGVALDMVLTGDVPPLISDAELGIHKNSKREVYSHYQVLDGSELRSSLEDNGIGHLVSGGRGFRHYGGTPSVPGHVTYAHPNDWRGREMPRITDNVVWAVGWVDDPAVSALVCAVGAPEEDLTVRPDGSTYHITLRTAHGVPPVATNHVLRNGWERLRTPFKISVQTLESSKINTKNTGQNSADRPTRP